MANQPTKPPGKPSDLQKPQGSGWTQGQPTAPGQPPAPSQTTTQGTSITRVSASLTYEGILPPPQMLQGYESVCRGAGDRIIKMAEEQSAHRRDLEKRVVRGGIVDARVGQVLAFLLALFFGAGGFWMIYLGKSAIGITTLVAEITALVAVFIYGRKQQGAERQRKRAPFDEMNPPLPFE